jgi:hypothetical protein
VISENVAASGNFRRLGQFCLSRILAEYEKQTQKERVRVYQFLGMAIEAPRGLPTGEAIRSTGDSDAKIVPPDSE